VLLPSFQKTCIIIHKQFILGRGKLKNFAKKYRQLLVFCLFILMFSIQIPFTFAQADEPAAGQEAESALDPLKEKEKQIKLDDPTTRTSNNRAKSQGRIIFETLLMLTLAAAAIYGVVYFVKKATRRSVVKDPHVKILASAALGSNRYVHAISVGQNAWLIGASDGGVNLISEITDKEALDSMLLDDSKNNSSTPGGFMDFRSILSRLGAQFKQGGSADSIRKRRNRLKGY